ncbi:MAG: amidohydrolase family protein [bacterium]|nr:amidohydrolase family protein [bacterium]
MPQNTHPTKQTAARPAVINGAEHAWVIHDPHFPITAEISSCPGNPPKSEYSAEHILSEMKLYGIQKTVISHVCYYGRNNAYTSYCVKTYPDQFAGLGLLVGHRLYPPEDPQNPDRLERAIKEEGLVGLRLSPIYNKSVFWLNDPISYPLWEKAQELGAVFNIFLAPHQVNQVADMARRYPGVRVVIDHIAMIDITAADSEGFGPLLDLAQYPNVYIRTSLHNPSRQSTPYRDVWPFLERIYNRFGPQRMIYANFFEFVIMKDLIPFFTAEDKEWILGKTAQQVYFAPR